MGNNIFNIFARFLASYFYQLWFSKILIKWLECDLRLHILSFFSFLKYSFYSTTVKGYLIWIVNLVIWKYDSFKYMAVSAHFVRFRHSFFIIKVSQKQICIKNDEIYSEHFSAETTLTHIISFYSSGPQSFYLSVFLFLFLPIVKNWALCEMLLSTLLLKFVREYLTAIYQNSKSSNKKVACGILWNTILKPTMKMCITGKSNRTKSEY